VPELPEVETVRADLEREIVGRPIDKVDVTGLRSTRRHPDTAEFVAALQGTTVVGVGRRGKYLLLQLDDSTTVVVHLRMSGQLVHAASAADERAKHTHVVLTFADGGQLRFVDPRTFGEWFVADLVADDPVTRLGPEPLDPRLTASRFGDLLGRRKVRLKSLLLDQHFLAGVGNIYGDEILFAARLRPDRRSDTLTDDEVRRLHRALRATLRDAIAHRGSTLSDEQYRDLYGRAGDYQSRHRVYGRAGQPCPRCRTPIQRLVIGGRSSHFCPTCQI
jgi:formamidopyrimidine-DNA glycosylase